MKTQPVILVPSAARTASGNSGVLSLERTSSGFGSIPPLYPPMLRVQLDVTAVSGTSPNLTVFVEDSIDGVGWNTVGQFAAVTGVNRLVINMGIRGDAYPTGFAWPFNPERVRVRWTITGTSPNFTFSVKARVL